MIHIRHLKLARTKKIMESVAHQVRTWAAVHGVRSSARNATTVTHGQVGSRTHFLPGRPVAPPRTACTLRPSLHRTRRSSRSAGSPYWWESKTIRTSDW